MKSVVTVAAAASGRKPGFVLGLVFFLCATPAVFFAAARVGLWSRRGSLQELAARLRSVSPFRWSFLNRPLWLVAVVNRWLPLFPCPGMGPCLVRSLILLDLWSRCGVDPKLHVAVRRVSVVDFEELAKAPTPRAEGHAWLSSGTHRGLKTPDLGYADGFSL